MNRMLELLLLPIVVGCSRAPVEPPHAPSPKVTAATSIPSATTSKPPTATATLGYERNRSTAALMLQERMVTTHIAAFQIRHGSVRPSPEEANEEQQWNESQTKHFSKHAGKVDWIWSHGHPNETTPPRPDEDAICQKFLSDRPRPFKPDEAKTTEFKELTAEHEYRYFEPIRAKDACLTMCHAPPPAGSGIDAMTSAGVSAVGGTSESTPPIKPGDVMAIARVTISVGEKPQPSTHAPPDPKTTMPSK